MSHTGIAVGAALAQLHGKELVVARRAADLRGFHFGDLHEVDLPKEPFRSVRGDWALHIQCPWRLDRPEGIVTGRSDLWLTEAGDMPDTPDVDGVPNDSLQDLRIAEWLGHRDPVLGSIPAAISRPLVLATRALAHGGAEIDLSGGYQLTMFPDGSAGEDWRLFRCGVDEPHFVITGGQVDAEG